MIDLLLILSWSTCQCYCLNALCPNTVGLIMRFDWTMRASSRPIIRVDFFGIRKSKTQIKPEIIWFSDWKPTRCEIWWNHVMKPWWNRGDICSTALLQHFTTIASSLQTTQNGSFVHNTQTSNLLDSKGDNYIDYIIVYTFEIIMTILSKSPESAVKSCRARQNFKRDTIDSKMSMIRNEFCPYRRKLSYFELNWSRRILLLL